MWVLDVVNAASSAVENTFYLVAGEWSIGRKKCHFNFHADSSISRSHALLRVGTLPLEQLKDPSSRPSLVLVDQNSRFGSFVNQEQCLCERELKNGDHVTFGAKRTILRVRYQMFILVASRIQRANRARVNETCQQIGIHLIASESKDATHCIMDPGKIVATVKVLWALVYNQPVVCTPWIYAILERKSMSEPLPRCEEFLPTDETMPSVASNYLPNPMRKTLYHRHVVVFLVPQSMEEIITEMAGVVIAAYKDSEHDELLLRDIEQHASSRHVLIVEPIQGSGFSSAAASSDGQAAGSAAAGSGGISAVYAHAAVERRVGLFRSISASFVSVQELAASVIFVKAPSMGSEYSFSSSLAGHNSSSVQICSFPDHLSLPAPSREAEEDDDGHDHDVESETASAVKTEEENTRTPVPEIVKGRREQPSTITASQLEDETTDSRTEMTMGHETPVVKAERTVASMPTVKEEIAINDTQDVTPVNIVSQQSAEHSHSFSSNVLSLDPFPKAEGQQRSDDSMLAGGWVSSLSSMPRRLHAHTNDDDDDESEPKPLVKSCSLIVRRPAPDTNGFNSVRGGGSGVNFKRFKKGNGYGARSTSASLFPQQMVMSVTADNAERVALEENLEALEEQERIADELFAMAENRGPSRRRF